MTAMTLIEIVIAVLLYIVVRRLEQIIVLQTEQRDLQKEQRDWQIKQRETLIHIANLLGVPYGEELKRKTEEEVVNALGTLAPRPHANRPQYPPEG